MLHISAATDSRGCFFGSQRAVSEDTFQRLQACLEDRILFEVIGNCASSLRDRKTSAPEGVSLSPILFKACVWRRVSAWC